MTFFFLQMTSLIKPIDWWMLIIGYSCVMVFFDPPFVKEGEGPHPDSCSHSGSLQIRVLYLPVGAHDNHLVVYKCNDNDRRIDIGCIWDGGRWDIILQYCNGWFLAHNGWWWDRMLTRFDWWCSPWQWFRAGLCHHHSLIDNVNGNPNYWIFPAFDCLAFQGASVNHHVTYVLSSTNSASGPVTEGCWVCLETHPDHREQSRMHTHAHDPSIANEQHLHTCGVTITFTKILRDAQASGIFRLLEKTLYLWYSFFDCNRHLHPWF